MLPTNSQPPFHDAPDDANDIADTASLWERWRSGGDLAARDQLIRHHLPDARMLAAMVFARRTHADIEFDDYLQLARVGLIEAVDRFDPGRGARFKTFASKRVRGAVLNGLTRLTEKNQQIDIKKRLERERLQAAKDAAEHALDDMRADGAPQAPRGHDRLFRYLAEVGIGLALGVLLENTGMVDAEAFGHAAPAPPSPEISYFRKTELQRLRSKLQGLVDRLGDSQKTVIRCHYVQEIPFEEIARIMGVSRGRVSQLHRQALTTLRERLGSGARRDVSC